MEQKNILGYISTNSMKGLAIILVILAHLQLLPNIWLFVK